MGAYNGLTAKIVDVTVKKQNIYNIGILRYRAISEKTSILL